MNRRGFTFVELLVALVIAGVVSLAVYQLLLNNQRVYRQQTQRADLNNTLRSAVAILPSELREVAATDVLGSDILSMTATSIQYKAMRTLHVLCAAPVSSGSSGQIIVWRGFTFGLRALDAARDSIVVFAERDPKTRADNYWLHANVASLSVGTACPGGAPSVTINLDGVNPSGGLAHVTVGAPARGFEVLQLLTYTDAAGDIWIGARQFGKGSGWSTTQPVLGPLAASGLQFSYFDTTGTATTNTARVARIGVTIAGMTPEPVRSAAGLQQLVDSLTTDIAVRNNRRQ